MKRMKRKKDDRWDGKFDGLLFRYSSAFFPTPSLTSCFLFLSPQVEGTTQESQLRVIVYKIQTLAGHRTSPIMLKFGMQSCFRVLTTKWMLKSSNSFYFGKYREGRFRVTLAARHYGWSKEFLLHQSWSCHRNFSTILVTDINYYPSLSYLWK